MTHTLRRAARPEWLAMLALMLAGGASAQTVTVTPSVTTRLTYTDNVNVDEDEEGDWIAEVAPGISISRRSGRFSGNLNAQLRGVRYKNETRLNTSFLALQGRGQVEAIEKLLFVDLDASTSRNNTSGFSGRSSGDVLNTSSSNETRQYSVGPRVQFKLGREIDANAGFRRRWFDGGGSVGGRVSNEWSASLSNPEAFGPFGWALSYSRDDTDFDSDINQDSVNAGTSGDTGFGEERTQATIFYRVNPHLRLRGNAGTESNDFTTNATDNETTYGGGFDWTPSERTSLNALFENRIFGSGYDVNFVHRRARSTWNASFSRDLTSSQQASGSVFDDPDFRAAFDGLEGLIPDPVQREAFVRNLLGFDDPALRDAFVTNAFFVDRQFRLGVSFFSPRTTVSLSLRRSDREQEGGRVAVGPEDDFAQFDNVRTDTASVSVSHRLTPQSALTGSLERSNSEGDGAGANETRRNTFSLALTTRLGRSISGFVNYRHEQADGLSDFTENVITASLNIQF